MKRCGKKNWGLEDLAIAITENTDWKTALEHIWGVELMEDNVEECKERILAYLDLDDEDAIKARAILDEHLVCSDFFEWDFENWCKK